MPEMKSGSRVTGDARPAAAAAASCSSQYESMAKSAALALSVSKIVSTMMTSMPPASRPCSCSVYAATSSINVTLRKDGSSTDGEMDAVRFVGPMAPHTKRGRDGSAAIASAHASLASAADARFSSNVCSSRP